VVRLKGGDLILAPGVVTVHSTHSRVVELIPAGSRVLDLGSGYGGVCAALKVRGCYVVGCDRKVR
jgi:hypothetical protein